MIKKVIFCDLDDTLIETLSGSTFPKNIWDMKVKLDVWYKIQLMNPDYVFIVTNQGGIGKFVKEEDFISKLDYITASLKTYLSTKDKEVKTDSIFCPNANKADHYRKPNIGMIEHLVESYDLFKNYTKDDMVMIGDASGKPGDFSDSDKKLAENYEIDYIDVREL